MSFLAGGGEALPTETPHFSKKELQGGAFSLSSKGKTGHGNHHS